MLCKPMQRIHNPEGMDGEDSHQGGSLLLWMLRPIMHNSCKGVTFV